MKKTNSKRILSLIIILSVFSFIFATGSVISSAGSYKCTNAKLQEIINKYEGTYWASSYHGAYQCKGFADMIFNELYGTGPIGKYNSGYHYYLPEHNGAVEVAKTSKASYKDIYNMMHKATSGNYIQWSRGYSQHSALFVSCDEKGFYVFDCNYIGRNKCGTHYITYEKLAKTNRGVSIYASVTEQKETKTEKQEKTVEKVTEVTQTLPTDTSVKLGFFETQNLGLMNVKSYTSSDTQIVTVSSDGTVKAVSAGNTTVTALLKDGTRIEYDVNVSHISYQTIIDVLFSENTIHESITNGI